MVLKMSGFKLVCLPVNPHTVCSSGYVWSGWTTRLQLVQGALTAGPPCLKTCWGFATLCSRSVAGYQVRDAVLGPGSAC